MRALDPTKFKRHAKAQEVARALLAGFGRPDACFLELQSFGQLFKCGRCRTDSSYIWEDMVCPAFTICFSFLTRMFALRFGTT